MLFKQTFFFFQYTFFPFTYYIILLYRLPSYILLYTTIYYIVYCTCTYYYFFFYFLQQIPLPVHHRSYMSCSAVCVHVSTRQYNIPVPCLPCRGVNSFEKPLCYNIHAHCNPRNVIESLFLCARRTVFVLWCGGGSGWWPVRNIIPTPIFPRVFIKCI